MKMNQVLMLFNTLAGKTDGTVTATVEASVTHLLGLETATTDAITLVHTGTVTADNVSDLNAISSVTFSGYTLEDSVENVNGHTSNGNTIDNLISRGEDITINEERSSENTALKLGTATSLGSTTDFAYVGTTQANIVELSQGLSTSNTITSTLDFGSDSSADELVFNVDEDTDNTVWVSFNSDGDVLNSATTFKFNKINNFELASQEDKFGIFYAGTNDSRTASLLWGLTNHYVYYYCSCSEARGYRIYEDELSGRLTKSQVTNTTILKIKLLLSSNLVVSTLMLMLLVQPRWTLHILHTASHNLILIKPQHIFMQVDIISPMYLGTSLLSLINLQSLVLLKLPMSLLMSLILGSSLAPSMITSHNN